VVAFAVLAVLFLQLREGKRSTDRRVGIVIKAAGNGVTITDVVPGLPAAVSGIQEGDLLLSLNGQPLKTNAEYDDIAASFTHDRAVVFEVRRGSTAMVVDVLPGIPFAWGPFLLNAFAVLAYLAVGLLAFFQRGEDIRGRLLFLFTVAVAMEMALPQQDLVGFAVLTKVVEGFFYLLTAIQFGLELHLASVIPERRPWLVRRPWIVPAYYVGGVLIALLTGGSFIFEQLGLASGPTLEWLASGSMLNMVVLPLWSAAVVVLLAGPALHHPVAQGRHQAGLILLGALPWAGIVYVTMAMSLLGIDRPEWFDTLWAPILLIYPVAAFVAIFRYHLFDIEFVLRRGLIYSTLTTALVLVFYAALGAGGSLLSAMVEGGAKSVWVFSGATLLLGLLVAPLRNGLQQVIDRRFFPERQALRRSLTALAGELPALGKLPAMVSYLIHRLSEIFKVETVTILVADPKTRVLVALASSAASFQHDFEESLLLSPDDAGLQFLRRARRPLPAAHIASRSASLAQRLEKLKATLVVPLLAQEELVGVLLFGAKEGGDRFPAEEVQLLELFSHHVAVVFENARLFASATYEGLTGLLRREAILEQLEREVARARRYARPLSVGMADLDHFKQVNDTHGHLVGDTILKRVAQTLAGSVRFSDAVGRYGGEEFIFLLPETELDGAIAVGEKVRSQIEAMRVAIDGGGSVQVTISVGIAALGQVTTDHKDLATALIALADANLLKAKSLGRNRVEPDLAGAAAEQ
jgi:two-component system, cell cycle response regulator